MKLPLHALFFLLFGHTVIQAQITKLSNNTNLHRAIPLSNKAVLVSDDDWLWVTDGSPAGTATLTTTVKAGNPFSFTFFSNKIYFSGVDANGAELWETDGTAAGTQMVKEIRAGAPGSTPQLFIPFPGFFLFFADNGVNGMELWKSDGTTAGTSLLKDINPGAAGSVATPTTYFINNGVAFFTADDGTNGLEVWKTDGTPGGTVLLKDINPGAGSSNALGFFAFNTTTLFTANDGSTGTELWITDGTTPGTVLVKDIALGFFGSSPTGFLTFNNKVYFTAMDLTNGFEMWVTDGTNANTSLLKDIDPGINSGFPLLPISFFANNKFIFPAVTTNEGSELWWSDGTGPNTLLFKDINPGVPDSGPFFFLNFFNTTSINGYHSNLLNGIMFLNAATAAAGDELWKTDGTSAGTVMVKDINPGVGSSIGNAFTYFYTTANLYFAATDGASGNELWRSDGSAINTVRVMDINPGAGDSDPQFLTYFNGIFLFTAHDGDNIDNKRDLFRLDGTFAPLLPLTLLDFTAANNGGLVELNWKTVSENNTSHFEIERGLNGTSFEKVGEVKAAGAPTESKYYFADTNSPGFTDKLYYRLKMVDHDGHFSFSNVVVVNMPPNTNVVHVFPNPVRTYLNVAINGGGERTRLSIFDASGKRVYDNVVRGNSTSFTYIINVAGLRRGSYYLQAVTDNGSGVVKFLKN